MKSTRIVLFVGVCALSTIARADIVTLYDDLISFQNDLAALSATTETIDFETFRDGAPVPPGDSAAANPLTYDLFGAANTATFSSGGPLVYENFVSISPTHSLRDETMAIDLAFGGPVAAVGGWALDIDTSSPLAASAVYQTTTLGSIMQTFVNPGGGSDVNTFLGLIATDDSGTELASIVTSVVYDQAGGGDFTYLDDLTIGVPASGALSLLGLGGLMGTLRRRK